MTKTTFKSYEQMEKLLHPEDTKPRVIFLDDFSIINAEVEKVMKQLLKARVKKLNSRKGYKKIMIEGDK